MGDAEAGLQDAAGLTGSPEGPIFGLTYKGTFTLWDLFMLRGSNGRRTEYNKRAPRARGCPPALSACLPELSKAAARAGDASCAGLRLRGRTQHPMHSNSTASMLPGLSLPSLLLNSQP